MQEIVVELAGAEPTETQGTTVTLDLGGQRVHAATDESGQAVFPVDDAAIDGEVTVEAEAEGFAPVRMLWSPSSAGASVLRLSPTSSPARAYVITTRANPNAVAAGTAQVGTVLADAAVRTNEVGTRYVVTTLDTVADLRPGVVGSGTLREFETYWEPVGWALDDWVATDSLPPGEDRAVAEASGTDQATAGRDETTEALDVMDAAARSATSTSEVMRLMASTRTASRGVHLGLGRNAGTASTVHAVDPVGALVSAVTGAIQLGVSAGDSSGQARSTAALSREIATGIEQATRQLRETRARALVDTLAEHRERRLLRAVRNPSPHRPLNLASFSLCRQWLVTTAPAAVRRVVLVPVEGLDRPFTEDEVFTLRESLEGVLLDPLLEEDLAVLARDHDPTARPHLRALEGSLVLYDDAGGSGSSVVVRASVRTSTGRTVDAVAELKPPPRVNIRQAFTIPLDLDRGEWPTVVRLSAVFLNPGLQVDRTAGIREIEVRARLSDDEVVRLVTRRDVALDLDRPAPLGEALDVGPSRFAGQSRAAARLLQHLNSRLPYYRLAVDLLQDTATRFVSLEARFPDTLRRVGDLHPVGATGTHIALPGRSPAQPSPDRSDVVRELVSVPTGATFVEAVSGGRSSAHDGELPRTPLTFADVTWPAITQLSQATLGTAPTAPAATGSPAVTHATGGTELKDTLAALATSLEKAAEQVTAATTAATAAATAAATEAAKKPEGPTPPEGEGDGTGGDGKPTTPAAGPAAGGSAGTAAGGSAGTAAGGTAGTGAGTDPASGGTPTPPAAGG